MSTPIVRALEKARALIAHEHEWTKGAYEVHNARGPGRFSYCARGALIRATQDEGVSGMEITWARLILTYAVYEVFTDDVSIGRFNDHPDTSREDVLKMYDVAIRLAKEEGEGGYHTG